MIEKIISGGQTGVDRAALDFAIGKGIAHGGWCPRGRLAEDGVIEARYQLAETPRADPKQRTEWNVRDSDGTVIFSIAPGLAGGSRWTAECAESCGKPWLRLSREGAERAAEKLMEFVAAHRICVLNVAGPRQSEEPEAGSYARHVLEKLLSQDGIRRAWEKGENP